MVRRWQVVVLNGTLLAVAAYLAGATLSEAVIDVWFRDAPVTGRSGRPPAPRHSTDTKRSRYDIITVRDLFRTRIVSIDAAARFRLVGVAANPPAEFAVIEDLRQRQQRLYRPGEQITEDLRTVSRFSRRMW